MRLDDLPVGVLEQVAERPVQDPGLPLREGRAVLAELRTSPSRLDADQPGARRTHERGEHADRVAAAADARDDDVGIAADPLRVLRARLVADHPLQVAHQHRERDAGRRPSR